MQTGEVPGNAPVEGPSPTVFRLGLAIAAVIGLAIRLVYAIGWRFETKLQYDGPVYRNRAVFLLVGRSFTDPDHWVFHNQVQQGAVHPPGNALWLAAGRMVGLRTDPGLQVWGCLLGVATVVVIGFLGREVVGPRVGLIAAAVAAIYPGLWSYDPSVMAETPAQFCTAVALLLGYRFFRMPSPSRAAYLGAAIGAGALMRSELAMLFPALFIPLVIAARLPFKRAALCFGAGVLWVAMVVGPWVGWNVVRFEHPVTLASGVDLSLAYAQCDETWYGSETGYWNVFCGSDITKKKANEFKDESELGKLYRARASYYITHHLGRWPVVIGARVGRTLSVYRPLQQVRFEHNRESREKPVLYACLAAWWLAVALAAVAFWRPPSSRRHLLPLLAPLACGIAGAAITFGTTRYRSSAEVGLVVLGAVGIDALARLRRTGAARSADPATDAASDAPATAG